MSARASATLAIRQYTDIMRMLDADHVAAAAGGEAWLLLAVPALWMIGVIVLVAFKFHSR
jgi:hypothetical protein